MTTLTFTLLATLPLYDDLVADFHVTARVTEAAYYRHTCLILFYVSVRRIKLNMIMVT